MMPLGLSLIHILSAITALTAQNTTGVTGIFETTPEFLAQQLDAVVTDIFPDAIKIGMLSSSALIETIAKKLRQYDAKHIVVDPVTVSYTHLGGRCRGPGRVRGQFHRPRSV